MLLRSKLLKGRILQCWLFVPVSLHRGQHATFAKSIQLMLVSKCNRSEMAWNRYYFHLTSTASPKALTWISLISFYSRYASDGDEQPVLESMRDYLIGTIQKTFEVGSDQAEKLYQELLQCTRNKNLVSKHFHCVKILKSEFVYIFLIPMLV